MKNNFSWCYFVSRRLSHVDRKGRTAVTSRLASLGVFFGVMVLIVVMSVMNGFQMSFIDAIMEISSYHLRVTDADESLMDWCSNEDGIRSCTPFYEAQGLMVGVAGRQSAAIVRAVPFDVNETDPYFYKELNIIAGNFDLSQDDFIVVGNGLAAELGIRIGSKVNLLALSGSNDTSLLSQDREFIVKGIFFSGYADINSAYSFINLDAGKTNFGTGSPLVYGIKLKNSNADGAYSSLIKKHFPDINIQSWREYNRSFFGVLRTEKNMLFLLVFLIFVVVAINIYNAMKRLVFERKQDIAVLSALGATKSQIKNIFIMQGARTGFAGSFPGLIAGLFLSVNIKTVFIALSKIQYYAVFLFYWIFNRKFSYYVSENSMFAIYAEIPARMVFSEIMLIFMFGIFSSLLAAWLSSRDILKMTVTEVLRDE